MFHNTYALHNIDLAVVCFKFVIYLCVTVKYFHNNLCVITPTTAMTVRKENQVNLVYLSTGYVMSATTSGATLNH